MARSTTMRLRDLWLQVHKWIGLVLAILIIPLCLSGSVLVWDDAVDHMLHPARYAVSADHATLPPSAYTAAAANVLGPKERISSIRYPVEKGPVIVSAAPPPNRGMRAAGPPARTMVWLDPGDARVLDKGSSSAGLVRFAHMLHGSLLVPGVGRQIVGWVGAATFISCLTGIWLWWPITGSVRRGFRWRRQNATSANLHHQMGIWILLPLAMLSLTGAWISFPQFFAALSGDARQAGGMDRARMARARPLEKTNLTPDQALGLAHGSGRLTTINWPTDQSPEWAVSFAGKGGGDVKVSDASGEVTPPKPAQPETLARTMRRWHDGTGMGPVWQIIIFIAGLIPPALAVTGIMMWLRNRGWRAKLKRKRQERAFAPAE